MEPRIKPRRAEQAAFSLGDKDGKGTVPCGSEWRQKGRAASTTGSEYRPSRTEALEVSQPLAQARRELSLAQVTQESAQWEEVPQT